MARTPTAEDAQRERTRAVTSTRRRTLRWHLQKRAYLLMLVPGLGMYLIFIVYPFLTSFVYSFYNWNGIGPLTGFIGLGNYVYTLMSKDFSSFFYRAILHNLYLFGLAMVLSGTRDVPGSSPPVAGLTPGARGCCVCAQPGECVYPRVPCSSGRCGNVAAAKSVPGPAMRSVSRSAVPGVPRRPRGTGARGPPSPARRPGA